MARCGPPPGARKVPGMRAWMAADGTPHGARGELSATAAGNSAVVTVRTDAGVQTKRSVARLMAEAWLPPRPQGAVLAHLDGDPLNNARSNLAWAPAAAGRPWMARLLAELEADPAHPAHGTPRGHRAGCRCARCRAARKVYVAALETRRLMEEVACNQEGRRS